MKNKNKKANALGGSKTELQKQHTPKPFKIKGLSHKKHSKSAVIVVFFQKKQHYQHKTTSKTTY